MLPALEMAFSFWMIPLRVNPHFRDDDAIVLNGVEQALLAPQSFPVGLVSNTEQAVQLISGYGLLCMKDRFEQFLTKN